MVSPSVDNGLVNCFKDERANGNALIIREPTSELALAKRWAKEQEFMVPRSYHGNWEEYENDFCERIVVPAGDMDNDFLDNGKYSLTDHGTDGWLIRLSADGYMDCTFWMGPFKTEEEALVELYRTYGD